jgi:hypothetical protein
LGLCSILGAVTRFDTFLHDWHDSQGNRVKRPCTEEEHGEYSRATYLPLLRLILYAALNSADKAKTHLVSGESSGKTWAMGDYIKLFAVCYQPSNASNDFKASLDQLVEKEAAKIERKAKRRLT